MPVLNSSGGAARRGDGSTPVDATSGAGEIAHLLSISRRLAAVDDTAELVQAVAEIVGGMVPHRAVALLPGGALAVPPVAGGGEMTRADRTSFDTAVTEAAGTGAIPLGALDWGLPPAPGGSADRSAPGAPLLMPLARRGGRSGLLAILPDRPVTPGEEAHRLLGGLAQEAALVADRLERSGARRIRWLEGVLDGLDSGVVFLDGRGRLRQTNREGRRLLQSLLGGEVVAGEDLARLGVPVPDGDAGGVEFCSREDQRTYRVRVVPLQNGGPGERAFFLEDISVERAREEQVREAERLSALGEMLSGVAHELNNPLSTVTGYAQLLSRQATDPFLRERLSIVVSEAERCRKIVQNLLDVARSRESERRAFCISDLMQSVVDLFAYPFRVDEIDVSWEPPAQLPLIKGDRHELQQVLINLVANAHQAMRGRPSPRCLRLTARVAGSRVLVEIADTGPGIPAAHLDRIFEPFFTTKEPGVGTGLGLSLARRTVRQHDGHLSVRSDVGAGATFVLDLAAMKGARAALDGTATTRAPCDCRILIVDDEDGFRRLLAEALGEAGNQVVVAADGAAALDVLSRQEVDVVVSDLRMPVMDGRELWTRLEAQRSPMARRFVLMTGDVPTGEMTRFLEGNRLPCLRKPFGLDEVERAVAAVLEGARCRVDPVVDSPGDSDETAPRVD